MTTATLLTLLVVPVFYTFFDDLRMTVSALLHRIRPSSQTSPAREEGRTDA